MKRPLLMFVIAAFATVSVPTDVSACKTLCKGGGYAAARERSPLEDHYNAR
jgi:hypothetical protein